MWRRISLLAIGGFAVVSLLLIRVALALDLAPPGAGFSATFPIEPKESSTPDARTFTWVASDQSFIYIVALSSYAKMIESSVELEASIKTFLTELKGRALSRKMTTASRPGGPPLPALQFTFAGELLSGTGIIVTDGDRTYVAMGGKFNGQNGDVTEIDRFMKAFRLTAKR